MKKVTGFLAVLLCMTMMMAGCSGKSNTETEAAADAETETEEALTKGDYKAVDYCTITEYKGLKFSEEDIKASDEEVQEAIDSLLTGAQELKEISEDRAVAEGDVVNIDYTGYLNGEAFEGGTDTGFDLEIGSGRFISGFEDGLIGHKKGEDVSLNLTFPDTYDNTELAGKEVVFQVKINSLQEYITPEYTDQFVSENTSFDTIDAYEKSLRDEIRENNLNTALSNKLMSNAAFAEEYPESLENYYKQQYADYFTSLLASSGKTLDQYLEEVGKDLDSFLEASAGEEIEQAIQEDLLINAVAEQEGIKAEGEDYEAYQEELASQYSMDKEKLIETFGEDMIQYAYITKVTYGMIYDSVIVE